LSNFNLANGGSRAHETYLFDVIRWLHQRGIGDHLAVNLTGLNAHINATDDHLGQKSEGSVSGQPVDVVDN
jgi:hypothetical protein